MVREIEEKDDLPIKVSQETLVREVLLDALDPERLSLETFDLEGYFDFLLKSIGDKFRMPRIILRYEDKIDKNKLKVLATFGFNKEQVKELTFVTKENSMAAHLARTGECYYTPDLFDPNTKFDQITLAEKLNLKSAFACPIFLHNSFVGFTIYHKTGINDFSPYEIEFLKTLKSVIEKIFIFAEKLSRNSDQFIKLNRDYSSALASILISFHDAKNILVTESEMIEKAIFWADNSQFTPQQNKKTTLDYLGFVKRRNEQAKLMVLETLMEKNQQFTCIGDLKELLQESITPIQTQLPKIQINLSSDDMKPISLMGNSRQLRQVFFNITYNAYRAIVEASEARKLRTSGKIDVTLKQDLEQVYIDITDNGIGIEEGRLSNILTKGESTWKKGIGTGIGLRLCKKIIGSHHGKIAVDSKYLEGTTVHIELPKALKSESQS